MLPILYQNNDLIIFSYPLLMGLGWGVGYQIFFQQIDLKRSKAQLLFWGLFLFAWLGAKILYLITSNTSPSTLSNSNFWLGGGFVFYGGVIGAAFYLFILKLLKFKFSMHTINTMILALVFGHAIGRVGCFLAGCCFGHETDLWWGIHLHGVNRHPTQLLEVVGLLAMGFWFLKIKSNRSLLPIYAFFYGILRFGLESLRGDSLRGEWLYWTPGEWISIFLITYGVVLLFRHRKSQIELK